MHGIMQSCYHTDAGYIESKVGRLFDTLRINEKSGVPVWVQIRNHMVSLIKMEQIKSGDILPTVRELAAQLGVNYNTIHKVYQDLERDGFIFTKRGKGTFVSDVTSIEYSPDDGEMEALAADFVQNALGKGMEPEDIIDLVRTEIEKLEGPKGL